MTKLIALLLLLPGLALGAQTKIHPSMVTNPQGAGSLADYLLGFEDRLDRLMSGAALVAPTSPAAVPGLVQWYAADGANVYSDDGVTPAVNGGPVQRWGDLSGGGRYLEQTTAGNRPTFVTNAVNGKPAISFASASSQHLFQTGTVSDPGTVLVVYKNTGSGWRGIMGADTPDGVLVGGYYLQTKTALAAQVQFVRTTTLDTDSGQSFVAKSNLTRGSWDIVGARADGSTLALHSYTADGFKRATTSALPAGATRRPLDTSVKKPVVGAAYYNHWPADFFDGQIAEVIVFDRYISDADFAGVGAYLGQKYGVPAYQGDLLWAHFSDIGSSVQNLMLMQSPDGVDWRYRPVTYAPPDGHAVRDPTIAKIGGRYWIAHTSNFGVGTSTSFDVAASTDGLTFKHVASVDLTSVVGTSDPAVWAPEWFVDSDGSVHVFVCASTTKSLAAGFRIYHVRPLDPYFVTWTAPVEVTGAGLPNNMLDPQMVKVGTTYHLWYKNENLARIEYASSASLTSGFTVTKSGDWAGWGGPVEGGFLLNMGDRWRLYLDSYGEQYTYSDSFDNWATWTARAPITAPYTPQHGSVIRVPQ